ncbi:MAG: cyclic nucleotide-binding domain-containing protein [Actinobacteria bacterium]|nr:cyclic nucleotide-binding domain-containing protein [Actinomycetota bacterium]
MPLRRDKKVELIKGVPLFSRCSKKELQEVAALADEIDLPEGRVLTREGDTGHEFFVILEGTAEVRHGGRKVRTLGPGDFLGEIALLTQLPRTATVTAATPLDVLVITAREFRSLLAHAPKVQTKVLEALAERLAATTL